MRSVFVYATDGASHPQREVTKMRHRHGRIGGAVGGLLALALVFAAGTVRAQAEAAAPAMEEVGNEAPWYVAFNAGFLDFEGNFEYRDAFVAAMYLGYDFNERWTFEGVLNLAPYLAGRWLPTGERQPNAMFVGLGADALFHFTRWERLDPYLAAGGGLTFYSQPLVLGNSAETVLRGGGGVMYHFNDEWAVRLDGRAMLRDFGASPDAAGIYTAGLIWNWGARVGQRLVAVDGPLDSDGDGLTDQEEAALGTDPFDPDTDKDRLTDGEEVKTYHTNPLNPDTDVDGLKDGEEVHQYKTDPLKRDTDDGGVADGHEVIEDKTNPLDGSDDLFLIELYIPFDYDKAEIKSPSFPQIDVVGKMLDRNPGSTARIEGHADKLKKSLPDYNKKLSQRRADAVLNYLANRGIERSRMTAVGYGYSRPKAENDPVNGNPVNRRTEVYLTGIDRTKLDAGVTSVERTSPPTPK
jgi:outer membrane protein OmpA-like peptidoglycan-associated protein